MKGFRDRTSVEKFFSLIDQNCDINPTEIVDVTGCCRRILADNLKSPTNVPNFNRSAMDGYALKGEETFGANNYNPISFNIKGTIYPGKKFEGEVLSGETYDRK